MNIYIGTQVREATTGLVGYVVCTVNGSYMVAFDNRGPREYSRSEITPA